ncbi:MAG TPA: PEP/pyruvate-binding domain-containing protein, partial [Candidatus Omnitrophota bacterium]|nr:PEP/pyruvate-binding domain-containing protein [Candidatus Omnitrophota bacterium]
RFFPDMAGVGISYNTYVWSKDMSPEAGMLRIVMGLGTRAVNRVEGDYPRITALDKPLLRPHAGRNDLVKYSQREVDVIDIARNSFETVPLDDVSSAPDMEHLMETIAERDHEGMRMMAERGMNREAPWIITFDSFFSRGDFIDKMKLMMKTLEKGYNYPVDIEFTVNLTEGGYAVNLLQCRPLQTRGLGKKVEIPSDIKKDKVMFSSGGYFFGGNISQDIHSIIYVDPAGYIALSESGKYDIARAVGKLNRKISGRNSSPTLLFGPGRWGTSTPSLGVPVSFSEINNIAVLAEISFSGGNLMPELSFGTHFFQDLVETEIFYAAIFPERKDTYYDSSWMSGLKNMFASELEEYAKYSNVIGVYDVKGKGLKMLSDVMTQKMVCYYTI